MGVNLRGRSFLKLLDFTTQEMRYMLDLARDFKNLKRTGILHKHLEGKNVAIIFEKDSTRTRCAFEVAAYDLGMGLTYLGPSGSQMGKKESIEDTAHVLGRFYDGIEFRGFEQKTVDTLAKYAGVPVWNGLTDAFHPTQILADFLTIEEHKGNLKGLKFAFVGDAKNNMGNSLMIGAAMMGMDYRAVAPKSCFTDPEIVAKAQAIAKETGAKITVTDNVAEGVKDADAVYADVWVSMGEPEAVWAERIQLLKPYQVNRELMNHAKKDAIVMHCLPAFHDLNTKVAKDIHEKFGLKEMEISDEVFRSSQSVVFDEAENRMHTIKAVMYATLK